MSGQLLGYARVSTTDQDLSVQLEQLVAAGVDDRNIFAEKKSGSSIDGRTELARLLSYARTGDTIIVARFDRFARSMRDFSNIVVDLQQRGIGFRALHPNIDTTGIYGEFTANLLMAVAQLELGLRKERQREGINRAKAEGRYKAPTRKRFAEKMDHARKIKKENPDMGASAIAKIVKCSRDTVYRACPGQFQGELKGRVAGQFRA